GGPVRGASLAVCSSGSSSGSTSSRKPFGTGESSPLDGDRFRSRLAGDRSVAGRRDEDGGAARNERAARGGDGYMVAGGAGVQTRPAGPDVADDRRVPVQARILRAVRHGDDDAAVAEARAVRRRLPRGLRR